MMRKSLLALLILGCHQAAPDFREWVPERDMHNFTLPDDVLSLAPNMQADFLAMIRFPSPGFKVKPKFVFRDQGEQTMGTLDPMVSRLDLLHFQVWQADEPTRHASVLFEPEQGLSLFSKEGWSLELIANSGKVKVEISDFPDFSFELDPSEDIARIHEIGDTKIFFYFLRPMP